MTKNILFIVVFGSLLGCAHNSTQEKESALSLSEVVAIQVNKKLPKMIDDMTLNEKVTANKTDFVQHYKLVNIRKADLNLMSFVSELMDSNMKKDHCANEIAVMLHKNGVTQWVSYRDMNNDLIIKIKKDMSKC